MGLAFRPPAARRFAPSSPGSCELCELALVHRYTYDPATYRLTDYTQHYLDLNNSNNATEFDPNAAAQWAVEYSFMSEYSKTAEQNASGLDSSSYFDLYMDVSRLAVPCECLHCAVRCGLRAGKRFGVGFGLGLYSSRLYMLSGARGSHALRKGV